MSAAVAIPTAAQPSPYPQMDEPPHLTSAPTPDTDTASDPAPSLTTGVVATTTSASASPTAAVASPTVSASVLPASLPAAVLAHVWWLGGVVLYGLEYVGEALADLLGITASPYQYVIDAKERQERWQRMEDAEEEAARVKFEDEQKQQQTQQQSSMEEGHTPAIATTATVTPSPPLSHEATQEQGI